MAQKTMQRVGQYRMIEDFAEKKPDGVQVWDFGDSQTVLPIADPANGGSYLTSSLCVLYLEGEKGTGPRPSGKRLPRGGEGVIDYGHGWKFIGVEFSPLTTQEEMGKLLWEAKEKLLGRSDDGKQVDAESVQRDQTPRDEGRV